MIALETLYARYGLKVLHYLIGQLDDRALAEEVLQDVMLIAWQSAARFRADSSVSTWLIAIARYRALKLRRRRNLPGIPLDESTGALDPALLDLIEHDGDRQALRIALRTLPIEQRETLELVFYHELTGAEAACLLGVAPGTIKSRLHRALITLRRVLRSEEIDHD